MPSLLGSKRKRAGEGGAILNENGGNKKKGVDLGAICREEASHSPLRSLTMTRGWGVLLNKISSSRKSCGRIRVEGEKREDGHLNPAKKKFFYSHGGRGGEREVGDGVRTCWGK